MGRGRLRTPYAFKWLDEERSRWKLERRQLSHNNDSKMKQSLYTLEMLVLSNRGQEFRRRRTFHHDQRGRELKEIRAIGIFQPLISTL